MEGYFSSITTQSYFLSDTLINQCSGKGSSLITHKPYTKLSSKHLQLACPLVVLTDNPLNYYLIFLFTYKYLRETLIIMVPIYLPYNFFSVHWNPNFTLSFSNNVLLKFIGDHLLQVNVSLIRNGSDEGKRKEKGWSRVSLVNGSCLYQTS